MQQIKEIFQKYGIEHSKTMERFLNNEDMYARLLGRFVEEDPLEKLQAALDAGELKAAFENAHMLKGVAGNLGLESMYQAMSRLSESLRDGGQAEAFSRHFALVRQEVQNVQAFWNELKAYKSL